MSYNNEITQTFHELKELGLNPIPVKHLRRKVKGQREDKEKSPLVSPDNSGWVKKVYGIFHKTKGPLNIGIASWTKTHYGRGLHYILTLDFDNKEEFEVFISMYREAEKLLGDTLSVKSSRGFHFIFLTSKRVKAMNAKFSCDVKSNGFTLAPPSIHPDGPKYEWLNIAKPIVLKDLSAFSGLDLRFEGESKAKPKLKKERQAVATATHDWSPQPKPRSLSFVPDSIWSVFHSGQLDLWSAAKAEINQNAKDETLSGIDYWIIWLLHTHGKNENEIRSIFAKYCHPEIYYGNRKSNPEEYFSRTYQRAADETERPEKQVTPILTAKDKLLLVFAKIALHFPFTIAERKIKDSREDATSKFVLLKLVELEMKGHRDELSERFLGEYCGLNRETVRRSLELLHGLRYISRFKSTIRIEKERLWKDYKDRPISKTFHTAKVVASALKHYQTNHDLWQGDARSTKTLGKRGLSLVYYLLFLQRPRLSDLDLSSYHTELLDRLIELGIVAHKESKRGTTLELDFSADLDAIAYELGLTGRGEARKAKHRQEQEQYKLWKPSPDDNQRLFKELETKYREDVDETASQVS